MDGFELERRPWFRIENCNVIVKERGALHKYNRHQHLNHELIAVERGVYSCAINGKEAEAPALSLVILNPGDWHEDTFTPPMRYLALGFALRRDDAPDAPGIRLLKPDLKTQAHVMKLDKTLFAPLLKRMAAESRSRDALAARALEMLIGYFILNVVRALPFGMLSVELQELLREKPENSLSSQLATLFERHISVPYSVPEMAHDMGMSESSLAHRCKAELGIPPAIAFARHKMSRAFELLKRTQMSVKETSSYLGFKNPYHFSKAFKRVNRMPPRDAGREP